MSAGPLQRSCPLCSMKDFLRGIGARWGGRGFGHGFKWKRGGKVAIDGCLYLALLTPL